MRMNPATGLPEDDYPQEYPSGAIAQQERDAITAPTFIDTPPPPEVPADMGGGDQSGLGDIGSADALPAPPETGTDGLPLMASNDLATPELPTGMDPGVDVSEPSAPDLAQAPPTVDSDGNATGVAVPAAESMPLADAAPDAAKPVEAAVPLSPADKLTADRIKTAEQEGVLRGQRAEIEQRRADAEAERKIQAQKETDQIVAHAEARLAESNARRQAEYDRFRDMSVKDSWGDHGTALRAMAGIAMLLGGRAGAGAYIVGASQGLEENKRTQLALQEKRMEAAGKSHEEAKAQTAEEFANFKMRQAAALDVTATRAEQELRAQGIDEAKIATNKETQQIRAAAEAGKIEARKLATKEQEQKLKDDLAKHSQQTKDDLAKSQIELNKARTGKLGKEKGAGGGGGGSLATLSEFIKNNPDDKPGWYRTAESLGYKGAKAAAVVDKIKEDFKNTGSGNAQTALRRERVAANIHEFNVNSERLKPGVITPEVLAKVQDNESRITGAEHSGTVAQVGGRFFGVVPKSKFDGLTPAQVTAMRALEATLQHGSEMQPTTGAEVSHQWKATYRPTPGMTQDDIDRSIGNIKEMGHTFRKIIDPTDIGARATAPDKTPPGASPDAAKKAAAERVLNDSTAPAANRARAKQYLDSLNKLTL